MVLPLMTLLVVCAASPGDALAQPSAVGETAPSTPPRSSVQLLADDIAVALQTRARDEGVQGGVRIVFGEIRGLDTQKVRSTLLPRVRRALKDKGSLVATDAGALTATVALSEERGLIWAVAVLNGPAMSGPSTVVVKHRIDRELEVALGTVSRLLPGRFVLERIAPLPAMPDGRTCPVLDLALTDFDSDPAQELAVLSTCGIAIYRADDGGVTLLSGPVALPERRWPRVALGWMVSVGSPELGPVVWAATSAGHSVFMEVRSGRLAEAPSERVPLRGVSDKAGPHSLHWRFGSPALSLPVVTPGGIDVLVSGLPSRVRDLARLPGADAWVFITDDGTLAARDESGLTESIAPERVGDRLLLVDVDADGDPEVVTTTSSSPGEPDQLVVRRLSPGLDGTTVLLKSPLGGGSVAAMAAGFADFDSRIDVVVLEETGTGEAMVWRLEHTP